MPFTQEADMADNATPTAPPTPPAAGSSAAAVIDTAKFIRTLGSRKFQIALGSTLAMLSAHLQSGAPWTVPEVWQIVLPLLGWAFLEGLADAVERAMPALTPLVEIGKQLVAALVASNQQATVVVSPPPAQSTPAAQAAATMNDLLAAPIAPAAPSSPATPGPASPASTGLPGGQQ